MGFDLVNNWVGFLHKFQGYSVDWEFFKKENPGTRQNYLLLFFCQETYMAVIDKVTSINLDTLHFLLFILLGCKFSIYIKNILLNILKRWHFYL